ncbi:protein of unknown function [Rhodovastum atsumiense]|nr:protein of unknown function [Rhodovastum atsumiense]
MRGGSAKLSPTLKSSNQRVGSGGANCQIKPSMVGGPRRGYYFMNPIFILRLYIIWCYERNRPAPS